MNEPLFGSASPIWNAMASPATPWSPIPSPSPIRMSPEALGYAPALPLAGGMSGPISAFGAAEVVAPAATIVAAVASRRGQPAGPINDAEIEDFLNDILDLMPGTTEVEVRSENGRVTVSGNVPHKRHKRDIGEIAWAIPSINDVQNNITIVARRRARATMHGREADGPVRKHA